MSAHKYWKSGQRTVHVKECKVCVCFESTASNPLQLCKFVYICAIFNVV